MQKAKSRPASTKKERKNTYHDSYSDFRAGINTLLDALEIERQEEGFKATYIIHYTYVPCRLSLHFFFND